jgi:hypothetical protein
VEERGRGERLGPRHAEGFEREHVARLHGAEETRRRWQRDAERGGSEHDEGRRDPPLEADRAQRHPDREPHEAPLGDRRRDHAQQQRQASQRLQPGRAELELVQAGIAHLRRQEERQAPHGREKRGCHGHVETREDHEHDPDDSGDVADRDEALGHVATENQCDAEEEDDREEIEHALEHDRREHFAVAQTELARAEIHAHELTEVCRQHVVAEEADHHRPNQRASRRVLDRQQHQPPAHGLDPVVDRVGREHRQHHPRRGVRERVRDLGEVGAAQRKPEEPDADQHPDDDQRALLVLGQGGSAARPASRGCRSPMVEARVIEEARTRGKHDVSASHQVST